MLDPLCHHSVTCKCGEDVTNRHNLLRNAVYEACHQASLSVRLEAGGGLGKVKALTRPADVLVSSPSGSASAAYDITVTSPLNPSIIMEAGVSAGSAANAAEVRKHLKYDVKCSELGWRCTPIAVETYGAWGAEACNTFSFIASRVAIMTNKSKSMILSNLYGKLSIILVKSNARAIMLRSLMPAAGGFSENI